MKPGSRVLRRALRRQGRPLSIGSVLICAHQTCEALVPILIGVAVDRAIAPGDRTGLIGWIAALAGLFLVLTTVYRQGARQLMKAIAEEAHLLRMEVSGKFLHPRGIQSEMPAGELLTVSTSDCDNVSYLMDYVPRIAGSIMATIVGAVALFVIDIPLGPAVLIGTPLVLVGLQLTSPLITKRVERQQSLAGQATSLATDLVSGVRPLRGIGAERAAGGRYRRVSQESLKAALHAARTQGGYLAASTTLSTLLACGIAILAGWFALTGRISVGQLITVIGLAQFLIEPFSLLAIVPSWVAEARASAIRVEAVLGAPPLLPLGGAAVPDGPLELVDVSYRALSGLSLKVDPGECVGVVAADPAEAEALVALLSGRVPPSEYGGSLSLGGAPLHSLDRGQARGALLVEPHRSDLFGGTVAANIRLSRSIDIDAALRASAADEVVSAHPDGLDHVVVERGANLSGGQRQRVALARALLASPPVLVLHDPTTAMDSVTEHVIAAGVRSLRHSSGSFSTVFVASSPALLAVTDRVVVVEAGAVVAEGTHAELAAAREDYRKAVLR
jgi:putative ABC transport system ATP-binding protein